MKRRRAPRGSGEQLREEILDAATELLLETGHAKAVSIRSVAQRVGVTPPSIYLHFADKDTLLDAVCARYFEKLDEEMQRVAADQPSTIDVLRAQPRLGCGELRAGRGAVRGQRAHGRLPHLLEPGRRVRGDARFLESFAQCGQRAPH